MFIMAQRFRLWYCPNGESITYSYVDGLLNKVTWPDGESLSYLYNEAAHIIGASKNSFLTGKLDSYGNRVGTYTYQKGKAISTEGFAGANKYQIIRRRHNSVRGTNSKGAPKYLVFQYEIRRWATTF